MSVSSRLGDASTRRRRHIRFAILAAVLLALAAVLVFVVGDDDGSGDFVTEANATCEEFSERLADEFELSFPEGTPNDDAVAEYLSHAFADTMDDLVAELRLLEPDPDAAAVIDDLEVRIDEVRADPMPYATNEAFVGDGISEQFDELGLTACGSDFALS